MSISSIIRRMAQPLLWRAYRLYNRKSHWHKVRGLKVYTAASVFHPRWFLTTRTLTDFALKQIHADSQVLELGAGNGVLALACSEAGAKVTASDINPAAVHSIRKSAEANGLSIEVIESDLFASIPEQQFDFIFINPPYFPGQPSNDQERAFLCGDDFEYFQNLFQQLGAYPKSATFMILTDACDLERIASIAQQNAQTLQEVQRESTWGEEHLIFRIVQK